MKRGRDSKHACPVCGTDVWISEVVCWSVAARVYWFLTGMCQECQTTE